MNLYADLSQLKRRLGIANSSTGMDTLLLEILESSSRWIDDDCCRHFYVETATRYFDSYNRGRLIVDDILSLATLKIDTDTDGVFDDETWTEGTDFNLWPYNSYPKTAIEEISTGTYSFSCLQRGVQIAASFGYGDGQRSSPVDNTGGTVSSINDSSTSMTVSDGSLFATGQTLLVDSEQLYVSAISGNVLTVSRGVNGTTAASHSSDTIYRYAYPSQVTKFCLAMSVGEFKVRDGGEFQSERIGDYSYTRANLDRSNELADRVLSPYRRDLV